MCGRTRCTLRPDDFPRACHIRGRPVRHINMDRYRPSYNVSPGFNLPVVCRDDVGDGQDGQAKEQGAALHCMKWGLVPSFTKKTEKPDHYKMFNARSESIREKASFRRLVPNNRCLVAVEGFYEWKKDGSKKQPYYINFKDGRPLVFAALFDSWKNAEGEVFYTFTILTTSSSSSLQWLHDRMPVIFGNKESSDLWLYGSPTTNFDALLKPYGESDLAWYPVTPAVGKPSFDGPECIKEIQLKTEESKPISHFFSKKGGKSQKEEEKKTELMEKEPTEIDQPRSMKEEHETLESTDLQSTTNKDDVKPNVSASRKGTTDFPIKREYEEFSADTEPYADQTDQLASSPERKKGKIAHDGEANIPTKEEYEEVSSGTKLKKLSQSPVKVTGADVELKHEFEEHSADTKHSVDQTGKLATSPMKKKGKGASDKQPTLFSYFKKN